MDDDAFEGLTFDDDFPVGDTGYAFPSGWKGVRGKETDPNCLPH